MPWLQKENPHIDWTQGIVLVPRDSEWVQLPLRKSKVEPEASDVNVISAKQMSRLLQTKQVERAYIGFIRMVKSTNKGAGEVHREESQGKWS